MNPGANMSLHHAAIVIALASLSWVSASGTTLIEVTGAVTSGA